MTSVSKATKNPRSASIHKVLLVILLLNWFVAILKLIYGHITKSQSMAADGFHSFSDGASNIVGLLGIWYASFPKDKEHPYGHKKYETFASIGIALLLFIVCFNIIQESFYRFSNPVLPQIGLASVIVMLVTLAINFFVMKYEYKRGKELKSDILASDSLHTKADIFTSCSVLVAFIFIKAGYPIFDTIFAFVIVLFIGKSAIDILRYSSDVLCDKAVLDAKQIRDIVMAVPGVLRCHEIRTRGREDDIHVDLHVLLADNIPLKDAHQLSSDIEKTIMSKILGVADVVVHLEPISSLKNKS